MLEVLALAAFISVALVLTFAWLRFDRAKEEKAVRALADLAEMGEVVPASLHPKIDPNQCIGSGACVHACPEKSVLALVEGRGKLANPLGCIGHGACASACPVQAIELVFGTATRGVELPRIDANFETNQPGVYVIGELGGMGLIRNAVSQGKQAADHVASSGRRGGRGAADAIVVGAGPAGIGATLRLMEAGLRVELLDREGFGGTILHYPRSKVVMTGPLDFPLFGRVSKKKMSKEELVELWNEIRERTNLSVTTGELVEGIDLHEDGMWNVRSTGGVRRAANVLLALGRRGSPQKLGVPGEELAKVAYRLIEPDVFAGKHVLVVGGGNSAVESSLALANEGACASVSISYRRPTFARCRAENRRLIEAAIADGRVRALLPSEVKSIGPHDVRLVGEQGKARSIGNDAVIVQIGGTAPTALLSQIGIELVTKRGEA